MPFTTLDNYAWLFDINVDSFSDMNQVGMDLVRDNAVAGLADISNSLDKSVGLVSVASDGDDVIDAGKSGTNLHEALGIHSGFISTDRCLPMSSFCPSTWSETSSSSTGRTSSDMSTQATSFNGGSLLSDDPVHKPQTWTAGLTFERPMSFVNPATVFPKLDELARAQIIGVIEDIKPVTPDGCYLTVDHRLLSLSSLQTYCDLYFSRFNSTFPLIHQSTFEPAKVETLLLISVLLLGATYCDKDSHQLAVS